MRVSQNKILAALAALLVFAAVPAAAQTVTSGDVVGKWSSTLKGFDHSISPPLDYEENVVLTISENGNIHLERTRRLLKSKGSVSWTADGVYTVPSPGVLRLTFSNTLGEIPATWFYVLKNNTLTITEGGSGISRKFVRVYTAI